MALKNGMFFLSRNVFEIGLRKGLSGGGERCEVQSVCPSRSCGPPGMIRHDVCHQHILSEWCRDVREDEAGAHVSLASSTVVSQEV